MQFKGSQATFRPLKYMYFECEQADNEGLWNSLKRPEEKLEPYK